jgi:ABC-type proline/glycine betaine transport system substrate-binding protein
MMTYDQERLIDDAWAAQQAAEARADDLLERLEATSYILSQALKRLGCDLAQKIDENNSVVFVQGLINEYGSEDEVVEAIVKWVTPDSQS